MRLVAFQPDIAANLGAMIRLGACFGAPIDVILSCGFPFSAKAPRRTAMDYVAAAEVVDHDNWAAFERDRTPGRLVLLSTQAPQDLWSHAFQPDDYLMLGRESAGAPEWLHERADTVLRIPMRGAARSLNVATAAAIALAEATRQLAPTDLG